MLHSTRYCRIQKYIILLCSFVGLYVSFSSNCAFGIKWKLLNHKWYPRRIQKCSNKVQSFYIPSYTLYLIQTCIKIYIKSCFYATLLLSFQEVCRIHFFSWIWWLEVVLTPDDHNFFSFHIISAGDKIWCSREHQNWLQCTVAGC